MSLRRQLLIVSLLLLSLPWAGCQFVREVEGALRQGQANSLEVQAGALASVLAGQPELLYPQPGRATDRTTDKGAVYAWPGTEPVLIDGYADGWENLPAQTYGNAGHRVRVRAQQRAGQLYLLFQISDEELNYHNPGLSQEPFC